MANEARCVATRVDVLQIAGRNYEHPHRFSAATRKEPISSLWPLPRTSCPIGRISGSGASSWRQFSAASRRPRSSRWWVASGAPGSASNGSECFPSAEAILDAARFVSPRAPHAKHGCMANAMQPTVIAARGQVVAQRPAQNIGPRPPPWASSRPRSSRPPTAHASSPPTSPSGPGVVHGLHAHFAAHLLHCHTPFCGATARPATVGPTPPVPPERRETTRAPAANGRRHCDRCVERRRQHRRHARQDEMRSTPRRPHPPIRRWAKTNDERLRSNDLRAAWRAFQSKPSTMAGPASDMHSCNLWRRRCCVSLRALSHYFRDMQFPEVPAQTQRAADARGIQWESGGSMARARVENNSASCGRQTLRPRRQCGTQPRLRSNPRPPSPRTMR